MKIRSLTLWKGVKNKNEGSFQMTKFLIFGHKWRVVVPRVLLKRNWLCLDAVQLHAICFDLLQVGSGGGVWRTKRNALGRLKKQCLVCRSQTWPKKAFFYIWKFFDEKIEHFFLPRASKPLKRNSFICLWVALKKK